MKGNSGTKIGREVKVSDSASRITASRTHAASKAPEGANGEAGEASRAARKVFILRRNNLSSSNQ